MSCSSIKLIFLKSYLKNRDVPGGPVGKTLPYCAGYEGLIPAQGNEIPHASWPKNQNTHHDQYCNRFNKYFFLMVHIKKKLSNNNNNKAGPEQLGNLTKIISASKWQGRIETRQIEFQGYT